MTGSATISFNGIESADRVSANTLCWFALRHVPMAPGHDGRHQSTWRRRSDCTDRSSLLSVKAVRNASLKVYPGLPHGMCTTDPDTINPDLLAFIKR
jgi:hypothetical protein